MNGRLTNIESTVFDFSAIKVSGNADKLFICLLHEIECRGISPCKEFTISEISDLIPKGTANVNNYSTYGFSIMSMLSGQRDRDYFIYRNRDLRKELADVCMNNHDRDNYYWRKECSNEKCTINPQYIKTKYLKEKSL